MSIYNWLDKTDTAILQFKNSDTLGAWIIDKTNIITWYWDNFTAGIIAILAIVFIFGFCSGIGWMLFRAHFRRLKAKVDRAEKMLKRLEEIDGREEAEEGDNLYSVGVRGDVDIDFRGKSGGDTGGPKDNR